MLLLFEILLVGNGVFFFSNEKLHAVVHWLRLVGDMGIAKGFRI